MPKKFSTTKRAPPAILSSTSEEENLEPSPKRPRGVAQSPDATSRHGSPRPSSGDEAHRSPSPVQEVASTRRPASRGRPRLAHFSNEVQQKLVEFYRQHPCLYDLEDPNFKDKELKKRLLEDIASELGIQTKQIETWFKTERRYYTENVMKPSASSGSAARKPTDKYVWSSQNFTFLDGHVRPSTSREQLGSGMSTMIPSHGRDSSEGEEDTQDSQSTQASTLDAGANRPQRRTSTKKLEDALVSGISSISQTGERIASSLSAVAKQPSNTANFQSEDDELTDYFRYIVKSTRDWDPKNKRRLINKVQSIFFEMAEAEDERQQSAPVAPPMQQAHLNQPEPSRVYYPTHQAQQPHSLDQAGPSWRYPNIQQQPHPVLHGPATQYQQPLTHLPRQQHHHYHQPTPVTVSVPTPGWPHYQYPQSQHSSGGPVQTSTAPVQLLPPRSPTPGLSSAPLETSNESAFSLTRMMNDELDRMHTDITPVHTDIQQQGKK